jgi:hypothetical protein
MVDHYPKLGTHEQSALTIFMAETKVKTSGWQLNAFAVQCSLVVNFKHN